MPGRTAAYAVMVDSDAIASIIAARFGSLSISMNTVSAVRKPGSNRDDAIALRRKIAAQISSSAEAKTWMPISALRARPGRASFPSSPRNVRTGSIRVACSAGIKREECRGGHGRDDQEDGHAPVSGGHGDFEMLPRSGGIVRIVQ